MALDLAESVSFTAEEMLSWLNRIRPESNPEVAEVPFTAETVSIANEKAFRWAVEHRGG